MSDPPLCVHPHAVSMRRSIESFGYLERAQNLEPHHPSPGILLLAVAVRRDFGLVPHTALSRPRKGEPGSASEYRGREHEQPGVPGLRQRSRRYHRGALRRGAAQQRDSERDAECRSELSRHVKHAES